MTKYQKLLQHPKWQKRRLEIMNDVGFMCEYCGDKDKSLRIHHKYYERDCDPWEYPDDALMCLCEDCHNILHNVKNRFDEILKAYMRISNNLEQVSGYMLGILIQSGHPEFREGLSNLDSEEVMGLWESYAVDHVVDRTDDFIVNVIFHFGKITHRDLCLMRKDGGVRIKKKR